MLDARPVVAFSITDDVICSAFINALIKFVIPCVVDVSCDDEIYPAVPRPTVVLCSEREEIYPIEPREFCKETICWVSTRVVLCRERLETYPAVARPATVLWSCVLEI